MSVINRIAQILYAQFQTHNPYGPRQWDTAVQEPWEDDARFVVGALCDTAAVERIAKRLYTHDSECECSGPEPWEDASDIVQSNYRREARLILDLLIEE